MLLAMATACGPTPVVTRTLVTFELIVSPSAESLMNDLTLAYRAAHPHIRFNMRVLNSARAMEAFWAGEADLAAVSWLTDAQRESVWMTPVAIDGVAIIVHPSNPVQDLSILSLRDVFRGRVAEWPDVGGLRGEIAVTTRESGSGTRAKFEESVMEGRSVTVNAILASSEQAVLDYVRTITTGVGYVSSGHLTTTVKAIAVEGVSISPATLADRRYPLSRPLTFVTAEEPQGELRAFVAWVLGPEGQAIVGKKYGRVK
jgi:phosphate transport system substrate-binding protein